MSKFTISYLVTTYNKLPYLRQVLGRLVAARLPDEEIVVIDGGSQDGTVAYLSELFEAGHIQQFVSERDKGESHGFNKAMLRARGQIFKYVTDDDCFWYPTIRAAAAFMLQHPEIDVMMGYNAAIDQNTPEFIQVKEVPAKDFQRWYDSKTPFQMIGLPLMVRRSSLALTGLFSTGAVMTDLEFTYRISSLKVNIAWCNGLLSSHISNPNGNFNRLSQAKRDDEYQRVVNFYAQPVRRSLGATVMGAAEALKRPIRPAKRMLFSRLGLPQYQDPERFETGYALLTGESSFEAIYRVCDEFMADFNARRPLEFKYKHEVLQKIMPA